MKNDSVSFKLVALVIIAGVIAAFLDSSSSAKPKPSPTQAVAVVATSGGASEASQ